MPVVCPICLGSSEKQFVALMCGHVFHSECYSTWSTAERTRPILMIPPIYGRCPVCKQTTGVVHKVYFTTADSCENEDLQNQDEWKKKLADLEEYKKKTSPLLYSLKEANIRLTGHIKKIDTGYRLEIQSLTSRLQCEKESKQTLVASNSRKLKNLDEIIKKQDVLINALKGEHRSDVEIGDIEVANACIHRLQSDLKQAEKSYQNLTKDLMALNQENSRLRTENLRLTAQNSTFNSVNGALKDLLKGSADSDSSDCVRVYFEIGHEAALRPKRTQIGFTHDWEAFVRGPENAEIHHFIKKVVFHLHDAYANPKRTIREPPYVVRESAYTGFILAIDIYYKNKGERKSSRFYHDLILQPPSSGQSHMVKVLKEKVDFTNPPEEFRRQLIRGGGMAGEQSISPPEPTPGPSQAVRTEEFVVPTPGPSGVLRAKKAVEPTPGPSREVFPKIIEISDESDEDTIPVLGKKEKATTSGFKILLPKKRRRN